MPFYRLNRSILELALGVQESLDEETANSLHPFEVDSRAMRAALRAKLSLTFAWHFFAIDISVRRFLRDFYVLYDEFNGIDYKALSAEETYGRFRQLESELLPKFGGASLLDPVINVSFGALHVLTTRWLPDAPPAFEYEVARPVVDVESVRPARALSELATEVSRTGQLQQFVRETAPDNLDAVLRASGDPDIQRFVQKVDDYIAEFGYRTANELKLEQPDMHEDSSILYTMLKGALAVEPRTGDGQPQATRSTAPDYLDEHLHGWRRRSYEIVRRKVQRSLRARESIRFCRTRAFGMARRMLRAIGDDLAVAGAIPTGRDVFYLRLDEMRGCLGGTLSSRELVPVIDTRKQQESENRLLTAPGRFTTQGPVYANDLARSGWVLASPDGGPRESSAGQTELRGTACSAGVAEGEANVVSEPVDVGGGILVTYRTDPGWIAVLPSASALLIERGSPLTHVAVVARELAIPAIVQIKDLTTSVRTGMHVRVDGGSGIVLVDQ
jgi:pyruvate,water dikinase